MPNIYDAAAVSREFVSVLREWLTDAEWAEMIARNKTPAYHGEICASHDFCDANMAMQAAFEKVMGREFAANTEAEDIDFPLWNAAWKMARHSALVGA